MTVCYVARRCSVRGNLYHAVPASYEERPTQALCGIVPRWGFTLRSCPATQETVTIDRSPR